MHAKFSCELYAHEYNARGASPASRVAGHADEVLFRDCLALRPDLAAEYEQLKLALWKPYEHDRDGYTAAKGGISALTHALAVSLAGRVRVNSVSPGWIDTGTTLCEGPDALQQPVGRVGTPMDIADMVLYLCSDKAGFITGENICIDGGMTRQMIYHGDFGWTLQPGDAP